MKWYMAKCESCKTKYSSVLAMKMHVCKDQVSGIANSKNGLQKNAQKYNSLQFIAMQYQDD